MLSKLTRQKSFLIEVHDVEHKLLSFGSNRVPFPKNLKFKRFLLFRLYFKEEIVKCRQFSIRNVVCMTHRFESRLSQTCNQEQAKYEFSVAR